MTDRRKVINLLRDHGFQLARSRKHHVYKNRDDRTVVLPNTPSDVNAWKAALADIKKKHGLVPEVYRPNARVRTPRPVPAEPAPMPVEAIAAERPLTAEEQALLNQWQREESKRLRKEARLLQRWEQEERQAQEKFVSWLRARAYMCGQQIFQHVERHPDEDAEVLEDFINEVYVRFFVRCESLGYVVHALHGCSLKGVEVDDNEHFCKMVEIKRAPGHPSYFAHLLLGVVVTDFTAPVWINGRWVTYKSLEVFHNCADEPSSLTVK